MILVYWVLSGLSNRGPCIVLSGSISLPACLYEILQPGYTGWDMVDCYDILHSCSYCIVLC